jgi:hypothetical protein
MSTTTTTTTIQIPTGTYTIDASHSRVGFVARHAMVTKVRRRLARTMRGSLGRARPPPCRPAQPPPRRRSREGWWSARRG